MLAAALTSVADLNARYSRWRWARRRGMERPLLDATGHALQAKKLINDMYERGKERGWPDKVYPALQAVNVELIKLLAAIQTAQAELAAPDEEELT
jgi:hypothetical protein